MRSIETSGKTVEDAIKTGLQELRLDSTEVIIDVLDMGSPGLFGMFGRLAKVRLTAKEKLDTFDFEMPVMTLDEQSPKRHSEKRKPEPVSRGEEAPVKSAAKSPSKREEPTPVRPARNSREEAASAQPQRESAPIRPVKNNNHVEASAAPQPQRENAPLRPAKNNHREEAPSAQRDHAHTPAQNKRTDARRTEPRKPAQNGEGQAKAPRLPKSSTPAPLELKDLPVRDIGTLSDEEKKAYDFLSNLTKLMGVEVEVRIQTAEEQMMVQLLGDTLGILIGRRGETLDALQYLTSLQVNKGSDKYLRVSLDTEHYRAKREEALQKLASRMAARVRKTGHRVALEPMNPYERRVLHSALQNHPYVSTHSEGEEPYRRVIITLK